MPGTIKPCLGRRDASAQHAVEEVDLANTRVTRELFVKVRILIILTTALEDIKNSFSIKLSQGLVSGGIENIINLGLF